jgi:hypothetical protein
MARRVEHFDSDSTHFDNVAIDHTNVFPDRGQFVSNDLCAER